MKPRILFYVQHLLGIGHLVRACRIAKALGETFEVVLVVGGDLPSGIAPEGLELFRLPAVRAGAQGFGTLVHPDGRLFDDRDKAFRRDLLLRCFDDVEPAVVVIEAFPFGRRQMRFELLPLLERAAAAEHRPLIACSIRDILQETTPDRQNETADLVLRYFDLVLVHGDHDLVRLEDSFPAAHRFADRIAYTGLVGPEPVQGRMEADETFEVVVSVGGGAVGSRLIEMALAARPLTTLARARWLLLTGPNAEGAPDWTSLDPAVVVRSFVPDLPARLARAKVSVSQAGYNTVADLVRAGCRAVLVPFASGGETEQSRRAALFASRGWAVMLDETSLDPHALASAVEQALALPAGFPTIALDGGDRTRHTLASHLRS